MPPAPAKNPGNAPGASPQGLKDLWDYNLTNHKPTTDAIRKIEAMRSASKAMAHAIIDLVPAGRDQALCLSNLELLLFHADAGITRGDNEDIAQTPEEDKNLNTADTASKGK